MNRLVRNLRHSDSGAVAIEFAVLFTAAMLFVLGLVEFGRALWYQSTLDYAVQSAARCGAVNATACGTVAAIQQYAVSMAPGLPVTTSNFTVTSPSCGVQVVGRYTFQTIVPQLLPYTMNLSATACFP
jgi:Flp pilus assembly protein TadG